MRKIAYTLPDGRLAIVHPVRNTHPVPEVLSDEGIEQRAWDSLPKEAICPRFVNEEDIPKDKTRRNSWVWVGGKISVRGEDV